MTKRGEEVVRAFRAGSLRERFRYATERVRRLPPHRIASAIVRRTLSAVGRAVRQLPSRVAKSYCWPVKGAPLKIERRLSEIDVEQLSDSRVSLIAVADLHVDGWFDILGSGWAQVRHGMTCRGLEGLRFAVAPSVQTDTEGHWLRRRVNRANVAVSREHWRHIDENYEPVDWHLDFKSGYRWRERAWHESVPLGYCPGRDMKVPWELSRFHHGFVLARAYALSADEKYARSFRNNTLDFMANNPPRFGINWRSPMDVSIRAVNWVLAYDLFRAFGCEFDEAFEDLFAASIRDHAQHIAKNIEWLPERRGNHYLADVAGLALIATYLPGSSQSDAWLKFAATELVLEINLQFGADGGNYEGSTAYHRLTAEMVVYAIAAVVGLDEDRQCMLREATYRDLPKSLRLRAAHSWENVFSNEGFLPPFQNDLVRRLVRIADFTSGIMRPDGLVPQIGDDDSGRFVRAQPAYLHMTVGEARRRFRHLDAYDALPDGDAYWMEKHGDHRHLLAAFGALLGPFWGSRDGLGAWFDNCLIENLAFRARSRPRAISPNFLGVCRRPSKDSLAEKPRSFDLIELLPAGHRNLALDLPGDDLRKGLVSRAWPDFGVYLFRSERLYLLVRCGPLDGRGAGGHAHNDQLSIVLTVDGKDLIGDPGSYLYTPLPTQRDLYRSYRAHSGPQIEGLVPANEGSWEMFRLKDTMRAGCLYFGRTGFEGRHFGFGFEIRRRIVIENNAVRIVDYAVDGGMSPEALRWIDVDPPFPAPAYGVQRRG